MAAVPQDHVKSATEMPVGTAQDDPFARELLRLPGKRGVAAILTLGVTRLDVLIRTIRRMDRMPMLCCVAPSAAEGDRLRAAHRGDPFVLVVDDAADAADAAGDIGARDQADGGRGAEDLARLAGVARFDVVVIAGSRLSDRIEGAALLRDATWIAIDGIATAGNRALYAQLVDDQAFEVVAQNRFLRDGYALFRRRADRQARNVALPVHFLTVAGDVEPFMGYHRDLFRQLPFDWTWHVVVGTQTGATASAAGDSAAALDRIAAEFPGRVRLYRKAAGQAWADDLEMANAPLAGIREECLLWRIDPEELWTVDQIVTARQLFLDEPGRTAAFYWCWYFVGGERVIISRNCYGQDPDIDWLRTWRYRPGDTWLRFDPPRLGRPGQDGSALDVGRLSPFTHAETEASGLVFQRFTYATEAQARVAGRAHGSSAAAQGWRDLQTAPLPAPLGAFLPWAGTGATVGLARWVGVSPLAKHGWSFRNQPAPERPRIVIDGVFFQRFKSGIARVWRSLLTEWSQSDFGRDLVLLDRAGSAPKIQGIQTLRVPAHDYARLDEDRAMLQRVCDDARADLFVSTYYTTPLATRAMFMAYDMIPEVLRYDFTEPAWAEKRHAIAQASAFVSISESSARDLVRFYPGTAARPITVAHCGVPEGYGVVAQQDIDAVKAKYRITRPYFMLSGLRGGYKNAIQFFRAFADLPNRDDMAIVATGPSPELEPQYRAFTGKAEVHVLWLDDSELKALYAGALALIYPSLYEGFGLPVVEAMACGCPVVTTPVASIPEVGGNAALYVRPHDVGAMLMALTMVQDPVRREDLARRGLAQVRAFSWAKMAATVRDAMTCAASRPGVRPEQEQARPSAPRSTIGAALDRLRAGNPAAARAICEGIIDAAPGHPHAHHVLGMALLKEKKNQAAVEAFLTALKHKPEFPAALNSLGVALHVLGRQAQAQTCFARALTLDAGHAQARRNLDRVTVGNATEALELDASVPDDALRAT